MTPDELVRKIFQIQEQKDPDSDPGDLTIDIQDDMPLVSLMQWKSGRQRHLGYGHTIQEALETALARVQEECNEQG